MNKSRLLGAVFCVFFIFTTSSHAELHGRLPLTPGGTDYQAAYDDVLDITWVTNAYLSGFGTWDERVAWANNLDYLGFNDWRLASMSVSAGLHTGTASSVVDCSVETELACRDNELGYMFYYNLGGTLGANRTGNQTVNGVELNNIQSDYWSGTYFDSAFAWNFDFDDASKNVWLVRNYLNGNGWAVRSGDILTTPLLITIDIKPGSDTNSINLSASGVVPVAILSSVDFDATTVDPTTVGLAGASVKMVGKSDKYLCDLDDINMDGLIDLVCKVYTAQFMIEEGETTAVMEAKTFDGMKLRGEDFIRIVPDN